MIGARSSLYVCDGAGIPAFLVSIKHDDDLGSTGFPGLLIPEALALDGPDSNHADDWVGGKEL